MTELEKVITGLEYCSTLGLCMDCVYHGEHCTINMYADAIKLLKEQQDTIASLQGTICKLNAALAEQPEQKFFVDSDGKMTPLPIQKHGHWKGFTQSRYFGTDDDGEPIFRDGRFYVCSECRRKSIIKYPYCPECGAKMDEEVKQDGS